jgi:hypothetical protein
MAAPKSPAGDHQRALQRRRGDQAARALALERAAHTIANLPRAPHSKSTYHNPQTRSRPRRGARAAPCDYHNGSGCSLAPSV